MFDIKKLYSPEPHLALGDFGSVENKELVERKLFATIKDKEGKWASRSHKITLQLPYKTMSYRIRVAEKAQDSSNYVLVEGIKPNPDGKLTYLELTRSVQPLGRYSEYTDEMMYYGFDSLVPDLVDDCSSKAQEIINDIAAKAWFSGNQVWTASAGLDRDLIAKIRISLGKFAGTDKQVYAIVTPEDLYDLKVKYNSAGTNLFEQTSLNEGAIVNGTFDKFEGVIFIADDSDYMYQNATDGHRNAIFYCADKKGNSPVGMVSPDGGNGEFIAKPLGSAGTDDPLNQKGSIGVKWKGLAAMVTSEETLARVDITPDVGSIGKVDSYYDFNNGKIYVNGNEVARQNLRATDSTPALLVLTGLATVVKQNTIYLTAYDEDGNAVTLDDTYTLESSNTSVATVALGTSTNAGKLKVTAENVGAAADVTVTVSKGRRSGSKKISVTLS